MEEKVDEDSDTLEEINILKNKLKIAENSSSDLMSMYEESVKDCEEKYLKVKELKSKLDEESEE